MKETIYYIETVFGAGLRAAFSIQQANKEAKCEVGADNVRCVRKASNEDIAWVKAMGGKVS